ncbi:jg26661 [Pararge aegeria aegeria]|uniref:Jg26661 protein n=1 Tax=Pararge aegeria aegeria TaxID=348720 RepID=A0A8S4QMM3_9NEOP|nr:jg26661 [Pararge aegeria aegeria]
MVTLCAVLAVSSAGLLPAAVHYSSASAVSSQNIVRHDQPQAIAKYAVAAPVAYHSAPAPIAYHAPIAKVLAQPEEIVIRFFCHKKECTAKSIIVGRFLKKTIKYYDVIVQWAISIQGTHL